MSVYSKIKVWSDKFENKAVRIITLWGSVGALITILLAILPVIYFIYVLVVDLSTFSKDKKKLELGMKYSYFCAMQGQSVDHEEMDSDTLYGVILQTTNHGDRYYLDTITINGVVRDITYGASVKRKGNKDGNHVYITDLFGNVRWIKPTIK